MRSICKKGPAILAAALALCALTAASASAAQWYVGGKAMTGSEKLAETVKVEEPLKFTIDAYVGQWPAADVDMHRNNHSQIRNHGIRHDQAIRSKPHRMCAARTDQQIL